MKGATYKERAAATSRLVTILDEEGGDLKARFDLVGVIVISHWIMQNGRR